MQRSRFSFSHRANFRFDSQEVVIITKQIIKLLVIYTTNILDNLNNVKRYRKKLDDIKLKLDINFFWRRQAIFLCPSLWNSTANTLANCLERHGNGSVW